MSKAIKTKKLATGRQSEGGIDRVWVEFKFELSSFWGFHPFIKTSLLWKFLPAKTNSQKFFHANVQLCHLYSTPPLSSRFRNRLSTIVITILFCYSKNFCIDFSFSRFNNRFNCAFVFYQSINGSWLATFCIERSFYCFNFYCYFASISEQACMAKRQTSA